MRKKNDAIRQNKARKKKFMKIEDDETGLKEAKIRQSKARQ